VSPLTGLPPIADSALPREIRDGSAADKKAYKAAMGFEQLLVGQLVQEMTKGSSLAEGPRAGATTDAMTDALTSAGGLGLADQLYAAMKLQEGAR
jgi:Rod binding domain-containing protein